MYVYTRQSQKPQRRSTLHARAQHGQTLIVALTVLFILLFIGGIFVVNVARNLSDSARGRDTEDARALAEAGLKYCDNELIGSPDGADWRPAPTPPSGPNNGVNDPDYFWLERGFTRLALKGGRALVRVSYDPDPSNPIGQAIKIESVGRTGELDPSDPTVFVQNQTSPRLRRELIAYKRIGITDYLRFITDKDKRNGENFLGVPGIGVLFPQVYGNPLLQPTYGYNNGGANSGVNKGETLYGGSVFCNANLSIIGDAYFYENLSLPQEGIFVAGNLTTNQYTDPSLPSTGTYNTATGTRFNNTQPLQQAFVNTNLDTTVGTKQPITPTLDMNSATPQFGPNALFNTYNGIVRDGSAMNAANGGVRSIPRLNPPLFDTYVNDTGTLRVRQITRESGSWLSATLNTGMLGWGTGIYVDNNKDLQTETQIPGTNGGYSLPADWTNPIANIASLWNGPFYNAPAVQIELLGDRMRLTRFDGKYFTNSNGAALNAQGNGSTVEIPFSDLDRSNLPTANGVSIPPFSHDGDDTTNNGRDFNDPIYKIDPNSYGVNIVLFAEGNISVKGVFGTLSDLSQAKKQLSRVHLTLITGGTAYIEGNIIKGDGTITGAGGNTILQRNSTCQILAKDYVCVNTTKFVQSQTNVWNNATQDVNAYAQLDLSHPSIDMAFSNGVPPEVYKLYGSIDQMLFLRHADADSRGPANINLFVNPGQDSGTGNSLFLWPFNNNNMLGVSATYTLGYRSQNNNLTGSGNTITVPYPDLAAIAPQFEMKAFGPLLDPSGAAHTGPGAEFYQGYPGYSNLLRFALDQTIQSAQTGISGTPLSDYILGGVGVAPLDIRIEAALYAQEKSFFIIPGYAVNPNQNDTRSHFAQTNARQSYSAQYSPTFIDSNNDRIAKDMYPFANEPLDVRITISGAIAENYTANVGAQAAWLKNWGYIPAAYGSSSATIPGDHLRASATGPTNGFLPTSKINLPLGYVAGDPGLNDYRSPLEKAGASNPNSFLLTRALTFEYDPALAMPYFHSTDTQLTGAPNRQTRMARSLRFLARQWPSTTTIGGSVVTFRQTLPPMPRLPIGPDLIYSGASDTLLGENPYDTDHYTGP